MEFTSPTARKYARLAAEARARADASEGGPEVVAWINANADGYDRKARHAQAQADRRLASTRNRLGL